MSIISTFFGLSVSGAKGYSFILVWVFFLGILITGSRDESQEHGRGNW